MDMYRVTLRYRGRTIRYNIPARSTEEAEHKARVEAACRLGDGWDVGAKCEVVQLGQDVLMRYINMPHLPGLS